jgi:hypothetical protein
VTVVRGRRAVVASSLAHTADGLTILAATSATVSTLVVRPPRSPDRPAAPAPDGPGRSPTSTAGRPAPSRGATAATGFPRRAPTGTASAGPRTTGSPCTCPTGRLRTTRPPGRTSAGGRAEAGAAGAAGSEPGRRFERPRPVHDWLDWCPGTDTAPGAGGS